LTFDQSVVVAGARVQLLWGERLLVEFVGRTNMAVGRAPIFFFSTLMPRVE